MWGARMGSIAYFLLAGYPYLNARAVTLGARVLGSPISTPGATPKGHPY